MAPETAVHRPLRLVDRSQVQVVDNTSSASLSVAVKSASSCGCNDEKVRAPGSSSLVTLTATSKSVVPPPAETLSVTS